MTSSPHNEVDELFDVKNSYYLGNYQQCIKEGQKLKSSDLAILLEKDTYVWRAYLAQKKYKVVLEEKLPEELSCVKLLAEYLSSPPSKRDAIVSVLESQDSTSDFAKICFATIYIDQQDYDSALRLLHSGSHLEISALRVHIYLSMFRNDLAMKEVKAMTEKDEDSTLTQLCGAWVNIANNGDKLDDAFYTVQEIIDKSGTTPLLANAQAAVLLAQDKFEEAWDILQDTAGDSEDTLINNMTCAGRLGKSTEVFTRILNQLQEIQSQGKYLQSYQDKSRTFDSLAAVYASK